MQGLPFLYLLTAEPAKCESDEDCFKGRARCIRKECHCTGHFVGDGKTKCDRKSVMPSNFYLLIQKRCKYYMQMLPYENDTAFTPRLYLRERLCIAIRLIWQQNRDVI